MKYILLILVLSLSFHADARRRKKAEKPPQRGPTVLNKNGIEYTVKLNKVACEKTPEKTCLERAALVATSKESGEAKWATDIYSKEINPEVPLEKQEINILSLRWKAGNSIAVTDEREAVYLVDVDSGALKKPVHPIVYPAVH